MINKSVNGPFPDHEKARAEFSPSPMMLIAEISRLMGDKIREKGIENPIAQKSGRDIIRELSHKDGRTQLELVNATHLKAPTISVVLQKLENDGYVYRIHDQYDMRAIRVFLTEKGKALDERIIKRIREEEARAMDEISDKEYDTLMKLLYKIRSNILEK